MIELRFLAKKYNTLRIYLQLTLIKLNVKGSCKKSRPSKVAETINMQLMEYDTARLKDFKYPYLAEAEND